MPPTSEEAGSQIAGGVRSLNNPLGAEFHHPLAEFHAWQTPIPSNGATTHARPGELSTHDSLPPSIRARRQTPARRCSTEPAPVTGVVEHAVGGLPGNGRKAWRVAVAAEGGGVLLV